MEVAVRNTGSGYRERDAQSIRLQSTSHEPGAVRHGDGTDSRWWEVLPSHKRDFWLVRGMRRTDGFRE